MSQSAENDVPVLIERVLTDHALIGERYVREKRTHADVCACGSLHPQFGDGRWPTHRRHVAEQIARVIPPAECDNYRPPLTCLTAPSSETGRCDKCRVLPPGVDL